MALSLQERVPTLLHSQLEPTLRYRCLILQTGDMAVLRALRYEARESIGFLGGKPLIIPYTEFLDDIGALPCTVVIDRIDAASEFHPIVLSGPLHFLAYWSVQMQGAFWKHLAGFTHGPGIIVIDTLREEMVDGPFRYLGKLPGTEVRYLKSRLATTQDGLV